MIVSSCQACHLRFEALESVPPVRLCPACAGAGAEASMEAAQTGRRRVEPPGLAPSLSDIGAPAGPASLVRPAETHGADAHGAETHDQPDEDWTPIEPVYVDFERPEPARAPAHGMGAAMALTVLLALGAVATLRGPIERVLPASVPVYERVAGWTGLGPGTGTGDATPPFAPAFTTASTTPDTAKSLPTFAARGLAIRNVSTQIRHTDAGERLVVRGEVHNGGAAAALPPLRVTIRDARGQARYRWNVATGTPGAKLQPGAIHAFTARSQRVPDDAASVRVDFATKVDFAQ